MSATAFPKGPQSHIIPINAGSGLAANNSEAFEQLPSLPHVSSELERYFLAARQIEAALTQQKLAAKHYENELRDLQLQYSRLASESENRIRDAILREDRLKSQLNTQQITYQQTEKVLQNQVSELSRQLEKDREERRKLDLDNELLKANLDHMKQHAESQSTMAKALQENEKSRLGNISQLSQQLRAAESELRRYKAAWDQVVSTDRKAKAILLENPNLKSTLEEMRALLASEKRRNEGLEDLLKRERRDKRAALTCFHMAEAKLTQASWELENMKKRYEQNIVETGFELKI
jgi:chromosome segregation ATPase